MIIVSVPIEPLQERYSAQWGNWFRDALKARHLKHINIEPEAMTARIRQGSFLDIVGTTEYKAKQIAGICQLIDAGTIPKAEKVVFIFQDGWFPIEQLAYMRDLLHCYDWKFIGIFHDGTYDKHDLLAREKLYVWGNELERSWFKIYDKIIVGSHYHKEVIMDERQVPGHKITVIPWKVEVPTTLPQTKQKIVVFPHRLEPDKQPEVFDAVSFNDKNYSFIKTRANHLTKASYYDLLAKSHIAVSTALLEMFGIAMVEAVLLGCVPLVPDRLAYREMYPRMFKYQDRQELAKKLYDLMTDGPDNDAPFGRSYRWNLHALKLKFQENSANFFPDLFTEVNLI